MISVRPANAIAITCGSRFSPLAIRNQVEATKAGEWEHVDIPTVSEVVDGGNCTIQHIGPSAAELRVDTIPAEIEGIDQVIV